MNATTAAAVPTAPIGRRMLNKVPEITIWFWLIKIMCTTVGETGADYVNDTLGFGLTKTTYVAGALLIVLLIVQFRLRRYVPIAYWAVVVVISVFGTLITDNMTDRYNVPLTTSTPIFAVILALVFAAWYASEKTLSIHSIVTRKREAFYWLAILFTFALGTAAGDLVAEKFDLGYGISLLIFGAIIALIVFAHYGLNANAVLTFWLAYIMTRPLGASIGDFLSQNSSKYGGLGLGTNGTSYIFIGCIVAMVLYLTLTKRDQTPPDLVAAELGPQAAGGVATSVATPGGIASGSPAAATAGGATKAGPAYRTILVAVDGSDADLDSLSLANRLGGGQAQVRTVHVAGGDTEADISVGGSFTEGLSQAVVDEAADLLVVGTHHHGHLFSRDHTRAALHSVPCSVAVAPTGYAGSAGQRPLKTVGVAYDETPESEAALAAARAVGTQDGAEVRLIEVVRDSNLPSSDSTEGWKAQEAEARLSGIEGVEKSVLEGDPLHRLRAAAGEVDLLVLGEHHPSAAAAVLLEDMPEKLAGHVACPLLVQAA